MLIENPRRYGNSPYSTVVVHGGPGASGEMAPVARELAKKLGVLEPLQTKDSIAGQVEELKQQIIDNAEIPAILVGWSWGAWLSYIVTTENPELVKKLIMVSSGPFESRYAEKIMPTRLSHLGREEGKRINALMETLKNGKTNNKVLHEFGELMTKADSYNPMEDRGAKVEVQSEIYEKVWKEAEELRRSGKLLEDGKLITCPVVVIHGDYDSHPYEGVREPLNKVIKNGKYILLTNCGHHPWYEKEAREEFYRVLENELIIRA